MTVPDKMKMLLAEMTGSRYPCPACKWTGSTLAMKKAHVRAEHKPVKA